MCDYVDLFCASFCNDFFYPFSYLSGTDGYFVGGLLLAVIDLCAISNKFIRYPAPIVYYLPITEEYAMHHKYRILCLAYLVLFSCSVKVKLCLLEVVFTSRCLVEFSEHDAVHKWYVPGE